MFLQWFNETNSERANWKSGEIYVDYFLKSGNKTVHVVMLDLRWSRSKSRMMSEEQWIWLEEVL